MAWAGYVGGVTHTPPPTLFFSQPPRPRGNGGGVSGRKKVTRLLAWAPRGQASCGRAGFRVFRRKGSPSRLLIGEEEERGAYSGMCTFLRRGCHGEYRTPGDGCDDARFLGISMHVRWGGRHNRKVVCPRGIDGVQPSVAWLGGQRDTGLSCLRWMQLTAGDI